MKNTYGHLFNELFDFDFRLGRALEDMGHLPLVWACPNVLGRFHQCDWLSTGIHMLIEGRHPAICLPVAKTDVVALLFLTSKSYEDMPEVRISAKHGEDDRWTSQNTFLARGPQVCLVGRNVLQDALTRSLVTLWKSAWIERDEGERMLATHPLANDALRNAAEMN